MAPERFIRLSDQCLLGDCLYNTLCSAAALKNAEAETKPPGSSAVVTTVHQPSECDGNGNCRGFVITETKNI